MSRHIHNQAATTAVLADVFDERARQDAKWGLQNHPDGTGMLALESIVEHGTNPDHARALCQRYFNQGKGTWALIAWEEFAEAVFEVDKAKLRTELVQCAAVFVAWIEKLDREAGNG